MLWSFLLQMGLRHLFLLLATLYLFYVEVEPDLVDKKVYCGQHLSGTLSSVCKGNYNTLNKKSAGKHSRRHVLSKVVFEPGKVIFPFNFTKVHIKKFCSIVAVFNRRSYWESQYISDEPLSDESYPFISKNTATSLITQFRRRRKRGVYNECCEKACTYEELMSYCA